MVSRVGRSNRRRQDEQLRRLLVRLSRDDRPAFDAIIRLIIRSVPDVYKKVYKK